MSFYCLYCLLGLFIVWENPLPRDPILKRFSKILIFFIFPQIQTVFVGVFECVCVFEQIVFLYLYIKIKYNFFKPLLPSIGPSHPSHPAYPLNSVFFETPCMFKIRISIIDNQLSPRIKSCSLCFASDTNVEFAKMLLDYHDGDSDVDVDGDSVDDGYGGSRVWRYPKF